MIVLDTHVLVWFATSDRKVGKKTRRLIDRYWEDGAVGVSAVSFWELGKLEAKRRLKLPAPASKLRIELLQAGLIELPLDGATAIRSLDLTGLPDDPADRFIAATALTRGAILVTADESILAWKHSLERHDARV